MKAHDLEPLNGDDFLACVSDVDRDVMQINRLNDLLAIVQQMEDKALSGHSPGCLCETPGCLGATPEGRRGINDEAMRQAYQRMSTATSGATVDIFQALKDVIDRHIELNHGLAGVLSGRDQMVPWASDACMAKRLHRLFAAAKAADVWPQHVGSD